jgi:tetratricopeptide (TPR) repeat protein
MTRKTIAVALLTFAFATAAHASWYDDYDAGLIAAKKGQWSTVISKMSAAIKGRGQEGDRVRTYGTIMINYHPYYYRGVAYLNTGQYDQAVADFERTSGPGPENLGSLDTLMERAKKMAAASEAEPEPQPARVEPAPRPTPPVVVPPAPTPAVPQIDPALRQRAASALASAKQKLQTAQQRRATTSPQYSQAMATFMDATTRSASARSNDELNTVIAMADNAGDLADLAMAPAPIPTPSPVIPSPSPVPSPIVPRPDAATTQVIDEHADDVKRALEQYFAGEFEEAAERFEKLTAAMPNNGWIYAFLGASQYSLYAFEADESYRKAAINSFRKAKQLRTWRDGLPPKYFSKRIRNAFREES